MLELTITNEQQIVVKINPVTDAKKPAKLDGAPVWNRISGPAAVNPSADGLSATLVSDDNDLTDTVIQVNADADLGSGVETISDQITLHVTHANATNLGLVAGSAAVKP